MRGKWNFCLSWTLVALISLPLAAEEVGVQWGHDLQAAKQVAAESGKLVLVHFWTTRCGPCRMLEENVFNQPNVAGAIDAQFVPVKLDANQNSATAMGFGVTRVPTDVILTPDGQVVTKLISPATPTAYIAEMTQVANDHRGQTGSAFASAVADANAQQGLNPAYANLPINQQSAPATETAPAAAPSYAVNNQYAPPNAPLNASTPPTQSPPATVDNRYAAATTTSPVAAPQAEAAAAESVPPPTTSVASTEVNTSSASQASAGQAATSTAVAGQAIQLPPGAPPLGFDGFCPVTMKRNWKWARGNTAYGAIHRGRTYLFVGEAEQKEFLEKPDVYAPALAGADPVVAIDQQQTVSGKREHSLEYNGQFYLFSSEDSLKQFSSNPERYALGVRQAMGITTEQRQLR